MFIMPHDENHASDGLLAAKSEPHPAYLTVKSSLPACPGVYFMKDADNRIIYVGKAKKLKARVASYFRSDRDLTPKTRAMLAQVHSIDTLCTETEKEALLLEASLIKKHRPRYNIVLRDDKQYVLFRLHKRHDFPSLALTRRVVRDGSLYYGPFTSAHAARAAWKAIHRVFPLRRCKDSVFKNRTRPCIYYDIGQCLGPCVKEVDQTGYADMVHRVELLLAGRPKELTEQLRADMLQASDGLNFEKAAELRDQLQAVQTTLEQQAAVLPTASDVDALGLIQTAKGVGLGLLFVRQGRLLDKKNFFWNGLDLQDGPELLASFLAQFYGPDRYIPGRIMVPWDISEELPEAFAEHLAEIRGKSLSIRIPQSQVEKKLVDMAAANARADADRREASGRDDAPQNLARRLGIPKEPDAPLRIECVDVSHTGGEDVKAGVVVFEDMEPVKPDYRLYTLDDPDLAGDDYGSLAAWLRRRLASGPPWPDLLLVDGGKGQLSVITRVLQDEEAEGLFRVAGIAKARDDSGRAMRRGGGDVADRIFLPGRKNPLNLKAGSAELLFLQHVRNTAHNFVIGRHRRAKRKRMLTGELSRLPGVGPKTAQLLWEHFPSLEAMSAATDKELAALPGIGNKKAAGLAAQLKKLGDRA